MKIFHINNSINENKDISVDNTISLIGFFLVLVVVMIIVLLIRTNLFMSVQVKQTSMNNTLSENDVLVIDRCAKINRGDIIVFESADKSKRYIKRVIAFEGETVYTINGEVYVKYLDGEEETTLKLVEPYVTGPTYYMGSFDIPEIVIEEGCLFVLGDNRGVSSDSRGYLGDIPITQVLGVVTNFSVEHKDDPFFKYLFSLV